MERASDRTLPVIQVAPRTLQDSLFALKIQGKAVFLFLYRRKERWNVLRSSRCTTNTPADGTVVTVCGWAKNIRDSKNIGFIALSDGGCFKTLQVVLEAGKLANYEEVIHTGLYSSLRIVGRIVLTPQAKQPFELNADSVEILGDCPADEYPLQKKKMSMEYLRTMPTLRPRTNTFNAAFRVRSVAAYAIHKFFQENGFIYSHSPLLTASDCEGARRDVPRDHAGSGQSAQDRGRRCGLQQGLL